MPDATAEDRALAALLDALLPGDAERWPAFSEAVPVVATRAALDDAMMQRVAALSRGDAATLPARIAGFERDDPAAFDAILRALYRAYYAAPAVQAAVRDLAGQVPREASPLVDPTLVAGVLARGAPRRRPDDAEG